MNPIIFIVIALGLGKLLKDFFSEDPEFEEINHRDIFQDFLIEEDQININQRMLKQKITRSINTVKKEFKAFKIGKTGNPKVRTANHRRYKKMFLLCSSNDSGFIESLERYYNTRFITDRKNDNKKEGSAGRVKDVNGRFYLYIVVR